MEVLAESPRQEMIMSRLRTNGLRPARASASPDDTNLPLVIDIKSLPEDVVPLYLQRAVNLNTRPIFVIGASDSLTEDRIIEIDDDDLSSLAGRLSSLRRKQLRDTEIGLRLETSHELGGVIARDNSPTTPHILYCGDGSVFFLALQTELRRQGIEITAALSASTTLDYLRSHTFSALLVDITADSRQGYRLLLQHDKEAVISAQPIFVRLDNLKGPSLKENSFIGIATEIVDSRSTPQQTAARIIRLTQRTESSVVSEVSCRSRLKHRKTGIFSHEFIRAHLRRQCVAAEESETSLSILILKLKSGADSNTSARLAQPDLVRLVEPLLRETDCLAHIDDMTLALSLPGTNYSGAVRLAERIVSELGGDNLGAPGTPLPFGGVLTWRVVERRRYHTADTLLATASSRTYARSCVA